MYLLSGFLLLVFIIWAFERFYLRGWPVGDYPPPIDPDAVKQFSQPGGPGPEHQQVVKHVREIILRILIETKNNNHEAARSTFDTISDGREFGSEFIPTDAGGVPAEWVITPEADTSRRVLYIHGGGFVNGSSKSHRTMTNRLSEITGSAVLAINYRLLPEYRHKHCVEDCRTAYQWILENGPGEASEIKQLFIAGDSAGGNLTLSLLAWIRDNNLRPPEAAVVLSPLTDTTFSGDSIRDNVDSDVMLRPFMKSLEKLPHFIKSWWVLWTYKVRPGNPVVSPLLGDLSGLPPILVQVSEAEMLLDDSRRYVYKACDSGSPVILQTWTDMVHIWQIFYPELPQAREAWLEIDKFLKVHQNSP
jgi:acetyl esterase/lipase